MKTRPILLGVVVFLGFLALVNCQQTVNVSQDIHPPQAQTLRTITPLAKTEIPTHQQPSILFIPTVKFPVAKTIASDTQDGYLFEILEDETCVLPCYSRIMPGKTHWNDAKELLSALGATYMGGKKNEDGTTLFSYNIQINANVDSDSISQTISQDITFILDTTGVVQKTIVWVVDHSNTPKFQEYWTRYSPEGVFTQSGVPDMVYLSLGGDMVMSYEKKGIVVLYGSFRKDDMLCPKVETSEGFRNFILTNPESGLDIFDGIHSDFRIYPELWYSIEELLGMNVQDFHNQLIDDPASCFEIKGP